MIILHHYKILFISMPKCATNSMYACLSKVGGVRSGAFHETSIPSKLETYSMFTIVRNPYDRMVAIYFGAYIKNQKPWLVSAVGSGLDFPSFCEALSDPFLIERDLITFCSMTQHINRIRFPSGQPGSITSLRLENLEKELSSFSFELAQDIKRSGSIPKENSVKRLYHSTKDHLTPEAIAYINIWAGQDFENFSYERFRP